MPKMTVYPTKHPLRLYHRDPIDCLQSLMNNPLLKNALQFEPLHVFKTAERLMRIYSEWRTGDVAWNMQVSSWFSAPGASYTDIDSESTPQQCYALRNSNIIR